MITKITSVTLHQTAEGMRASFTFSVIDEDGNLIKSNQRATVVLVKEDILQAVTNIYDFLLSKVPA